MKTALITGITGQDGAYLSRLLLQKGYTVIGLVRSMYGSNLDKLRYLQVLDKSDKAKQQLKWDYTMDFFEVVDKIIEESQRNNEGIS